MSVPLELIIVNNFVTTCQTTGSVAVFLGTGYVLMEQLVQVYTFRYVKCVLTNNIHTDVNECLTNNGGCAHTCTNDIGSYTCSCRTGYVLDNDNHHCIGTVCIVHNIQITPTN